MMDRDVLKELASLRNKKVFGPSDFYDMVDTVAFAGDTIDKLQTDVADFRHERNAAQQRAEQAERERDEAREYLRRITAIVDAWARVPSTMANAWDAICGVLNERDALTAAPPLEWTPKTGAEIVGSLTDTPILPTDFDVNAAPTVKVGAGDEPTLSEMAVIARNIWIANNPFSAANNEYSYNRELNLFSAVGRIIDLLDAMIKRGAS